MNFTPSQQLAIDLRNRNILISAAAGSGKTATLTERIIQLITDKNDPADISSMLVVTYTRAAAGELRARISRELGNALALDPKNAHLARQLTALGSAMICTIDSYYLDLARSNFQRLGIPSSFRLADETELLILRYDVMNAVIERRYQTDPDFIEFADEITTARGEGNLAKTLLDIYAALSPIADGTDYLHHCAEQYRKEESMEFFKTRAGISMLRELNSEVSHLIRKCDRMLEMIDEEPAAAPYGKAVAADRDHLAFIKDTLLKGSYAESRLAILDYSAVSLGSVSAKDKNDTTIMIHNMRNEIKAAIENLKKRQFSLDPDDLPYVCQIHSSLCLKMKDVLDDYISAYEAEKSSKNICEFADLKKYALKLLINEDGTPSSTALEQRQKFAHIFIDEHQDTDSIQDKVFNIISRGNNLFFVGDIKQSIYSFRGAEPSVFASYRKAFLPAPGRTEIPGIPLSVYMSENFRCSPNIIDFTNSVCSYLFRETECDGGGIGFVDEDNLIASRTPPYSNEKVRVMLLEKDANEECSETPEHAFVISEIKKILKDKKNTDGKPYKPKDIAILTQTNREATAVADALARAGIPHANSTGEDLFENPEVLLMLAILSIADNPRRDIPLAAGLRSPVFGFSISDLVNIRLGRFDSTLYDTLCDYSEFEEADEELRTKCKKAVERIEYYRLEAESMPVHEFLRSLWRDISALTYAGSDPESVRRSPIERRRNLRMFYEYARKYEASAFKGIHDFVEYIGGIISQKTKVSEGDTATDNTVQIMTVHKSKGLEFPTVFIIGTDKPSSAGDAHNSLIFTASDDIGLALKVTDTTGLGQLETPFRVAASTRMTLLKAEEDLRVLYVALTRARDDLYILASGAEGYADKVLNFTQNQAKISGRQVVLRSNKWIERILTALSADPINRSYVIETPPLSSYNICDENTTVDYVPDKKRIEEIKSIIRPCIDFKYNSNGLSEIPAKISVSRLYPELLNDKDDAASIAARVESLETRTPRFLDESDSAADKGTATHLFMQFCKFENLKPSSDSVKNEIARLVSERFIPENAAKLIRINEIVKFISSSLFQRVLSAQSVEREFRFNVFLPASYFTDDPLKKQLFNSQNILVQGVIDLYFTDSEGNIVLCDYKTDRLTKEEIMDPSLAAAKLKKAHGEQLSYYAMAIEKIYGKRPDKILIFSLCLGREIEITV